MHRRGPGPDRQVHELLQRVAPLPLEQQQQALENDEGFRQLPAQGQERIRRLLDEVNQLPPERRRAALEEMGRSRGPGRRVQETFLRIAPLSMEEQAAALEKDEFFQSWPPRAQERFRRELESFRGLSPEEQQRRLERLRHFAELPSEDQQRLRRRAHRFAGMPPEQRHQAQQVFQAWQRLEPERRKLLLERLRRLQQAPQPERDAMMEDPTFLTEQEKQLFREVWRLRRHLPPADSAPQD